MKNASRVEVKSFSFLFYFKSLLVHFFSQTVSLRPINDVLMKAQLLHRRIQLRLIELQHLRWMLVLETTSYHSIVFRDACREAFVLEKV